MLQRKILFFFIFIISALVTTIKPSHNGDSYSSCAEKCKQFYEGLEPAEKDIFNKEGFNFWLQDENTALKDDLSNSLNKEYRNLTLAIAEGLTISVLLYYVYKLFQQNKLYREAEETLPDAQKTASLKKVVPRLHEIEKNKPEHNDLVNQIYKEQLAPEHAVFKHNYSSFKEETNKYTDKLNIIQQKLEECHKSPHETSIQDCLKEIASMSKYPVQPFIKPNSAYFVRNRAH
jgi:hypothetical protein